jgi:HD-GYP domain-containing protein (c-di-GMP phosphodiesterase class II)
MIHLSKRDQRILEVMLIVLVIGMTCLVSKMGSYKLVTLNLFFLPVVLAAFFLGRYTSGILAVFCVATMSLVCMLQVNDLAGDASPLATGLAVTIWGAILCLTALLVGTLSDERSAQAVELHEAYVGVVEVLAKYLQGGNSHLNACTSRVVDLSQRIALEMKLSSKHIDDLRVAALMQGFSKIEVTTKVISKAVHSLEAQRDANDFSFHGTDLVYSLGIVLRGAIPILLGQDEALSAQLPVQMTAEPPIGANILSIARAFSVMTMGQPDGNVASAEAIRELRSTRTSAFDMEVLDALERVVNEELELVPA